MNFLDLSMTAFLIVLPGLQPALAAPLQKRADTQNDDGGGFQLSIYIPVIVILAVLVLMSVVALVRKRAKSQSTSPRTNAQGVVEVTANQLTGRTGANTTNNTGAPAQTRRGRRNRRRASQMSVTSLPLYMEEAGDTELVLVRGEREMHDTLPDHSEEHESDEGEGEVETPNDTEDASHRRGDSTSRRSYDSDRSTEEDNVVITSPLMEDHRRSLAHENNSQIQDSSSGSIPQEDAPPYTERSETTPSEFRNVDLGTTSSEGHDHNMANASQTAGNAETAERPASGNTTVRRLPLRAMPNLRSLFTRTPSESNNNRNGNHALAASSSRTHLLSHQRSNSSFSNSSSMLHLTPTTSRLSSRHLDRSMNASQISLASIGAPLQHTLTKTEFSYPKTGPTQEQMKFLGSRESLALFGVPFGSAAVAYSRVEPPPFMPSGSESASGSGEQADSLRSNTGESQEPLSHVQEATDETIINSPPGPTQSHEEPIPEESANDQDVKVPNRADAQEPISLASVVLDPTMSSPSAVTPAVASATEEESGPFVTPKMIIPITIIRGPSPAPPTPPPTPPRQSLAVEAPKPPTEVPVTAGATA